MSTPRSRVAIALITLIVPWLLTVESPAQDNHGHDASELTDAEAAAAVTRHIRTQSAKHGAFWVYDSEARASLRLKFVKIDEKLCGRVRPQTYFANAIFTLPDGASVRVDVLLQGADVETLEPVEVSVQERDGKERYRWFKEGGFWRRKSGNSPEK